jgi:hypothetical protein
MVKNNNLPYRIQETQRENLRSPTVLSVVKIPSKLSIQH